MRHPAPAVLAALAVVVPLLAVAPAAAQSDALAAELEALEVATTAQGCDPIDEAGCLLPFPSNHLTVEVGPDQIGGVNRGGTGRRVDFNVLGMPRNTAGKPIDPTEWNRNDGFSPGQMLMTYVPGVAVERDEDGQPTGPVVGAVSISDPAGYTEPDTAVVVIDVETGQRHPIWVETDLNAGYLFPPGGETKPGEPTPALMIRPAVNYREGARYVVALRDLVDDDGQTILAQAFFSSCRDGDDLLLPGLTARCGQLHNEVFPVLEQAGVTVEGNAGLYAAWDFTVASTENNIGRMRHMRDEAFAEELGQVEDEDGVITDLGRVPDFAITEVRDAGNFTEIHGSLVVPSYVTIADPSPLETADEFRAVTDAVGQVSPDAAGALDLAATVSLPPNRLYYDPTDEAHPDDPTMQPFGDGLPDRTGTMEIPWVCRMPVGASAEEPARVGTHGHGQLGRRFSFPSQMMNEYNHMFCNADWFGFATGDLANVASLLPDVSNFPVVPDAGQQGVLNKLFLLRLLSHPDGIITHPAFHDEAGSPRIDTSEVFYYGGSQGGILGGPVVALSKDVTRGGLRVPGMSYSLLLRRSTGFSPYSMPLYASYLDDLDRSLIISLIQMLWDRAEGNGYAHHITDNTALRGPDNTVLMGVAFADHQVTHWSAENMARTIGVELADFHPRHPDDCAGDIQYCFGSRQAFQESGRSPNVDLLWGLPLTNTETFPGGRSTVPYDDEPGAPRRSAMVMFDNGRTASPPLGNIPANHKDSFDPHGHLPTTSPAYRCMQTHFLHPQGRLIDVRNVVSPADCPPLPPLH